MRASNQRKKRSKACVKMNQTMFQTKMKVSKKLMMIQHQTWSCNQNTKNRPKSVLKRKSTRNRSRFRITNPKRRRSLQA
jgi:hypothetical protein